MKKIYFILALSVVALGLFAQDDAYYWYRGQKVFFNSEETQHLLALVRAQRGNTRDGGYWEEYTTNRFLVKLKHEEDYDTLQNYITAHNFNIVSVAQSAVPLWYILSCPTSNNVAALANEFHESTKFAAAEPEIIGVTAHTCVNDPNFSQQWNLLNTGQNGSSYAGLDVNYCDAHAITSGNSSVTIALIDVGVDSTHEDLPATMSRYDILSQLNKNFLYDTIGTATAGVIGAITNNSVGVAGIAPGCSLMSISVPKDPVMTTYYLAEAIMYATEHGASVINAPWYSILHAEYIDDAIKCALNQGRNGKGCVVVFGSGNLGTPVMYPAENQEDILVVGAMSPCGERKNSYSCDGMSFWASAYGEKLDVVAPGVAIVSTDTVGHHSTTNSYTASFWGTSASCAQVSAVAGLVLSINPNLTQKEVGEIICSTAQKVGSYSYDSVAPYGQWDFEMGYGLVDAYAAVKKAQLSLIEIDGPTYLCGAQCHTFYSRNVPSGATYNWSLSNPVSLLGINGANTADSICIGLCPVVDGSGIKEGSTGDETKGFHPHEPSFPPIQIDSTGVLSLMVTKDGVSYTKQKNIFSSSMGIPRFVASDTATYWPEYTTRSFTITNCAEVSNDNLEWSVQILDSAHTNMAPFIYEGRSFIMQPTWQVTYRITAVNKGKTCGNNTSSKTYIVVNNSPSKAKGNKQSSAATKLFRDGQLYIIKDGKMYNSSGVPIKQSK